MTTVLIVDDHKGFRSAARTLLEAEGYAVVGEADDGASAIAAAAELLPMVVLLDVQLPDMDGFEVCSRLRGAGHENVVLTSSRDWSECRLAEQNGARGFIPKGELSGDALGAMLAA